MENKYERSFSMIPKKIHYCWFGRGEKSKLEKKCIASWEKYCPNYEIIEWNEDNFPVDKYPYAKWCLKNKKYAFLSDFVRLVVVSENGGFYFDTDVELLKSLDFLLKYKAVYGFETKKFINTGHGFAAETGHFSVKAMLEKYIEKVPNQDGDYLLSACPALNTIALIPYGLIQNGKRQSFDGVEVFPADYFNPYDDPTGKLNKTKNTVSIHWYSKSWLNKGAIIKSKITRPFHKLFGNDCFVWIKRYIEK